jgi:hypothetical protein
MLIAANINEPATAQTFTREVFTQVLPKSSCQLFALDIHKGDGEGRELSVLGLSYGPYSIISARRQFG